MRIDQRAVIERASPVTRNQTTGIGRRQMKVAAIIEHALICRTGLRMNGFRPEYIRAAIQNEANSVACAATSTRNEALNKASFNLASLGVPGCEIIHSLRPAALQNGLKKREIYSTINSGMRAGRRHPRSAPANSYKGPEGNTTPSRAVETASAGMVERRRHDASSFPSCDAPHKFKVAGDKGPSKLDGELRRHIYPRAGRPVRVKIKLERYGETGFQNWYAVTRDGVAGWQAQKPAHYVSVPYVGSLNPFDSELTSDALMWPEGEKDVDTLTRLAVPSFTFGGTGDGLPVDIESYLKDRHLVILADNDQAGRDHAEKKAALAHSMGAASIKIVHFPELPEKNDVSDFIEGGGTVEQLVDRATKALLWRPDASPSNGESDAEPLQIDDRSETDAEIKRLAKLTPIEYERERKSAARKLGIGRVLVLDSAVKAVRGENSDTKGQGRPLELPTIEPWPEPVNGAGLLDDICNAVKRYLVLPEGSAEVLALWAIHTHALERFEHSPRLAITSPEKQCGKTTTLDVLGEIVARPLPTSNATTAAIFRTIEIAKPTLLIDEADTFLGENEELRGVLNSGHRRGGQILRTVGDDHEPRQFATWAPAAIAMIGRLPDTLEDRSVSIALRRRRPTEKVQQFRSDRVQDLKQLARKIARWCDDNQQSLAASNPDTGTLANRPADNWRPLLSIADLAGGRWPEHARAVAEAVETAKQDQSKRTMVLSDIRDIFATRPGIDRLRSAEMAEVLGVMENRPWSEWRNGKPMTPAALARLLAPFGITPGTKRDREATFKGYLLSDFREAFATYLPDQTVTPSQPNNDEHCDGLQSVTPENDVTVSKCNKPNNDGHCDGVTVSNPHPPDSEWIDL